MIWEVVKRKKGSRRPWTPLSNETVENLISSQESGPSTHLSLGEIEMETGIH